MSGAFTPAKPAEFRLVDDPVYGTYAMSWYCSRCLNELGVDLADPAGEVPGCPSCGSRDYLAWCEWGDVLDEDTGRPLRPGPLAETVWGARGEACRTRVSMSATTDIAGNVHHPAGSPAGGQFATKSNSAPNTALGTEPAVVGERHCSQHGGQWGTEPACTNCADQYGRAVDYPFPALRDGIRAHEVDMNLYWRENPEGPSRVNPAGGVWQLVAHPIHFNADGMPDTDTLTQHFSISVAGVPEGLSADKDCWWSLDTAPEFVRGYAVGLLAVPSAQDRAMSAAISAAELEDRSRRAAGHTPTRPAND